MNLRRGDRPYLVGWTLVSFAAFVVILRLGRGTGFYFDDWDILMFRHGWDAQSILGSHNEHITVVPVLIYKLSWAVFGLETGPLRVVLALMHIGCATLVFDLSRRRTDTWVAFVLGALVLCLGAGWHNILVVWQISFTGSVFFGLLAWWALDRDGPRWEALAAFFLLLSTGSSLLGIPFIVAVAVEAAWSRNFKRLWIPAVSGVLYLAWYSKYGIAHVQHNGVLHAPSWGADAAAAALAALFGLAPAWGPALVVVALVAAAVRLTSTELTPRLLGVAAMGIAFWLMLGSGRSLAAGSPPESSRFLLAGAVTWALLAAELLHGVRIPPRAAIVPVGAVLFAAGTGFVAARDGIHTVRIDKQVTYSELAALKLVGSSAPPTYRPGPERASTEQIVAGPFLAHAAGAVDFDPAKAGNEGPAQADRVLRDLAVRVRRGTAPGGVCQQGPTVQLTVPPGRSVTISRGGSAKLAVRRFSGSFVPVGKAGGAGATLTTVRDSHPSPYIVLAKLSAGLKACVR